MRWSDDSKDAGAARFRDITRPKPLDLSWTTREGPPATPPRPDVVTLRPPRVPVIDGEELEPGEALEYDDVSGLHRASDAMGEALRAAAPATGHVETEKRRTDTMIDEIVPRAEEEAIGALREALERAARERDELALRAEQRLVDLALLVARRVIAREVSLDPAVVRGLVHEGIRALGEQDRLVVRVGRFFAEMKDAIASELVGGKIRCEVIVDPALGETGCVVETELGRVDESIEARLANLIEGLSFDQEHRGRP